MPNTETTFADIYGRAQQLQSAISTFQPPFLPTDPELSPASFAAFLGTVDVFNAKAGDRRGTYSASSLGRAALVKEIKARALRAMSYLKSNVAWKKYTNSLKPTYDKLRGYPAPKTPTPSVPPENAVAKKKISTGQQSYSDIEGLFAKFYTSLTKVPGYAPAATEITLGALNQLDLDLKAANDNMATQSAELAVLIKDRAEAYELLRERTLAIKAAVSAQYGNRSSEYVSIKGLKF